MTPAPFMARVGAKLLDTVLYGMVLPIPAIIYLRMTASGADPGPRNIAVFLMVGLIGLGFFLMSAAAETHYSRTPGKKLMGLHVVRESGTRIGFGQAIVRQLPVFLQILSTASASSSPSSKAHSPPDKWWSVFRTIFEVDPSSLGHGVPFPRWSEKQ